MYTPRKLSTNVPLIFSVVINQFYAKISIHNNVINLWTIFVCCTKSLQHWHVWWGMPINQNKIKLRQFAATTKKILLTVIGFSVAFQKVKKKKFHEHFYFLFQSELLSEPNHCLGAHCFKKYTGNVRYDTQGKLFN